MKLLAVSLPRHDANISYFDGEQLHYIKLERLKRQKRVAYKDCWSWIEDVKTIWGVSPEDVDAIIFDFHVESFYQQVPSEIQEVIDGTKQAVQLYDAINPFKNYIKNKNVWYISHHYAHARSSWMLIEQRADIDIVVDGVGDHRTWSVFKGDVLVASGLEKNGSIGGYFSDVGRYLGLNDVNNSDVAGKVMGLQSYGNLDKEYLQSLKLFGIKDINSIYDISSWNNYKIHPLVGHATLLDWAKTVNTHTGSVILNLFKMYALENDYITYSGGVAQNVVWNTDIKKSFPNLVIPPHSGDEGLSLGSIEWLREQYGLEKFCLPNFPYIQEDKSPSTQPTEQTILEVVDLLASGKIVGWYQGNGEAGPRALGNRSILMDPRVEQGKTKINAVKNRETYRPFGASVLLSHAKKYFDICAPDPFMLYTANVKVSNFQAITHVDGTCRVQTVEENSGCFSDLLGKFYEKTGCPVLLNTSLNLAGKPIAGSPNEAKQFFYESLLDYMIVGNKILSR